MECIESVIIVIFLIGPTPNRINTTDRHECDYEWSDRASQWYADHSSDQGKDKELLRLCRKWQGMMQE